METLKGEYIELNNITPINPDYDAKDILNTLGEVLNGLRDGSISPEQATRESQLIGNILKAYDMVELKNRLDAIEAVIGGVSNEPKSNKLVKKGKLTGEEVGQLIIKDMIEAFKQILTDPKIRDGQKQAKGLLTPEQKQVLVNKLDTKEDIRDYNNYRALYDFLTDSSLRLDLYHKEAQVALWRLIHLVSQLKNAEDEYTYTRFNPTIMTQKQYDKLKQQEIDKALTYTESIESFIIHALQYYIELYLKVKKHHTTNILIKLRKS